MRRLQPPKGEKDMPYAELNSLYHHVLSNVDDIEALKQVLGFLIIICPVLVGIDWIDSTGGVDSFFFWQPGEMEACLSQLASIIKVSTHGKISILHASLSDFLLDPSRARQFYLCRESILGDCAALGLCQLRQQVALSCGSFLLFQKFILGVLICRMFYSREEPLLCGYRYRMH